MQTITLYRTIAENGRVTVSPNKPEKYDSTLYRLVADEGKELVKGEYHTTCIDTDTTDGWTEQDAPWKDYSTLERAQLQYVAEQLEKIKEVYAT